MPAPALLKSLCDGGDECAEIAKKNSQSTPITQGDRDIEALSAMTAFTKRTRREKSTKTLFQYYSGWLHRQITFSFSLSSGAGAFSIAPALEVQIYRGEGCWAETSLPKHYDLICHGAVRDGIVYADELIGDYQQAM